MIHQGIAFNGKRRKIARSQGKKFQVSIEQQATRLLGNLGWAYMQQSKFLAAEAVYRKALLIESDVNKVCNLGICLMKQGRLEEAKSILRSVILPCNDRRWTSDSHLKSFERAQEMMEKLESSVAIKGNSDDIFKQVNSFAIPGYVTDAIVHDSISRQPQPGLRLHPCRITKSALESKQVQCNVDPSISGPLVATSGFGLAQSDATPDMTGNFRRQAWLQGGSCSGTSGGWIEDDLYYTSPDESSDGSDIHEWPLDFKYYLNDTENDETQFSVQNNLRMRSESAIDLKRELCNSQLGLNCEADAYFPTSTVTAASTVSVLAQGQEEQPFNSTSTSSQAELLRHLATPMRETDVTKQVQYQQLLLRGLSPCPIGAGKRYEAIAPGNPLDFTINPDEFDFNRVTSRIKVTGQICEFSSVREFAEGFNSTVNVSAFEMNLRKQRRLRVFQEMAMSQTIQAV